MGAAAAADGVEVVAGMQEFFAMGGHGLYVWLSYGLSWSVILVLVWRLRIARREFVRLARARSQRLNALDGKKRMSKDSGDAPKA